MANQYRFDSGQLVVPATLTTAYTVSGAYNAGIINSCLVVNRTASVSGQQATITVSVHDSGGTRKAYWANNIEIPAKTSVDLLESPQSLPANWTVQAQASVSGAIDISVSAVGVIYA